MSPPKYASEQSNKNRSEDNASSGDKIIRDVSALADLFILTFNLPLLQRSSSTTLRRKERRRIVALSYFEEAQGSCFCITHDPVQLQQLCA
jgi:hypothetical protein